MSIRTLTEVNDAILAALLVNDMTLLPPLIDELAAIGTDEAMAWRDRTLGLLADSRGQRSLALEHFQRSLEIFQEIGDQNGIAAALMSIGGAHLHTGEAERALEPYHQSLEIMEGLGDRGNVAVVLSNLGHAQAVVGDSAGALESFMRALEIHQDLDQPNGIGSTSCNIGNMYKFAGDLPTALEYYHRALGLFEQTGNKRFLGNVLMNMGGAYDLLDNHATAMQHHQQALAVFEELEFPPGIAISLSTVGLMYSRLGQPEAALEHMARARTMLTTMGDTMALGNVLANMMSVLNGLDRWTESAEILHELESLHLTNPHTVALRYVARSTMLDHSGDQQGAIQVLHDALDYLTEHPVPDQQAQIHKQLRDYALQQNDLAAYVEHNNEYTRITEEINGKNTATKLAMLEAQRVIEQERKEHEKQLAVLYATLPKPIADRVARGETVSDHFENAAVLFLDVVGFTTHSSELPSHQVTALLEDVFRTFDAICKKHGVVKVKTIGDAYLCFAHEGNGESGMGNGAAERIAAVALAMQDTEFYWPSATDDSNGNRIQFRIGIHSGPVTAGVIGTERLQYDIWGDTVNVASRMESNGVAGQVNVSEAVAEVLSRYPQFVLEPRGSIDVKGKGAMEMYLLLRS